MTEHLSTPGGLTLRPWRADDAPGVRAAFSTEQMERQTARPVTDLTASRRWLAERTEEWASGRTYSWAVTGREGLLGCVQVGSVDHNHGCGWVSYWTVEAARGRGVATEGVTALAGWAFGPLGLYRLELGHRVNNPASCRVARRAGFAVEGLQRGKLRYGEERHDVELHARLATDPPPG
ncbi:MULTISPECIES: GNAT family N-acetyltransferase [unclassified Streptomyces]|uniref:GNAT family N-acetyltransferase n=1 Tax=unclassified Streptomyces TaxID=2593676 RepID=UPI000CD5B493|nr:MULTISPECIES: GNAT family N-acetyltransferase [unclassified Streptomyces]